MKLISFIFLYTEHTTELMHSVNICFDSVQDVAENSEINNSFMTPVVMRVLTFLFFFIISI